MDLLIEKQRQLIVAEKFMCLVAVRSRIPLRGDTMRSISPHGGVSRRCVILFMLAGFACIKISAAGPAAAMPSDTGFFPIAVWLQSPSNASAYKNAGINLYVGLWEGPTKEQLDQLTSAAMPVLCDQNAFALANIEKYKNTIAGWMHMDEPDNAQSDGNGGYGPCVPPDSIIKRYAAWKSADPLRPVYLNLGQGVAYIDYIGRGSACHGRTDLYPRYIRGCDIVSFDIYPVNSGYAAVKGNLWYVPKGIDSLRRWSGNAKKAWCWIECTRIDSSSTAAPVPLQVKAEVWLALIHGANGFGYFCHSWYGGFKEAAWLGAAEMKTAITAINKRISALAPVLNGPSLSNKAAIASNAPIDIMVKSHAGSVYIFAAAASGNPGTAAFSIAGLSGPTAIEVLDEDRTLTASDGKFQDSFEGYGVHLYRINSTSVLSGQHPRKTSPSTARCRRVAAINGRAEPSLAKMLDDPSIAVYTLLGGSWAAWSPQSSDTRSLRDGVYIVVPGIRR